MIIGIEGASGTGKTTLAAALAQRLGADVVDCHRRYEPTLAGLPECVSSSQVLKGVTQYLDVESVRVRSAQESMAAGRDVILDGTIDTPLAYAHAIGRIRGFDCDREARQQVLAGPCVIPDVTLHLLAPPLVCRLRAAGRGERSRLLDDTIFIDGFRDYFRRPIGPVGLPLTATAPLHELTETVEQYLRQ